MNQTLKVSAFLCLCFALTNANIFDGLHGKKPSTLKHEKTVNNLEKKPESITVVNTKNSRVKRQVPFGFGMDTSFMDYAAYDYYDWVCSGGTCQLCDVLTGACCVPNRNNNCFLPDSCANNPCLSGGTCITTRTVDGQPDFVCVCQRGLTGKYCQLIDEFTPPIMQPIPIPMGTAAVPVGGAAIAHPPPPAGGAVPPPHGGGAPVQGGGAVQGGAVQGGAAPVQSPPGNRMMGMSSFTNNVPASAQTQAVSSATGMMGGGMGGGMGNMMGGGMGMGGMGGGMPGMGGMGGGMGNMGMGGMGMGGMGGGGGGMPGMGGMGGGMGGMGGGMPGMGGMGGGMGNMMGMGGGMGGMGMGGMGMGGMGAAGGQGNMMG